VEMFQKTLDEGVAGDNVVSSDEEFPSNRIVWESLRERDALLALPESDRLEAGRVLFFNACNDCHSVADGYSSVAELMRGWTPEMIRSVVEHPERAQFFMPPFAGMPEEVDLLTEYLVSIARPYPPGLQIPGGG